MSDPKILIIDDETAILDTLRILMKREGFQVETAVGGQAGTSSLIRNYLGFPHGIPGRDLALRAAQQAWLFGAGFHWMRSAVSLGQEDGA